MKSEKTYDDFMNSRYYLAFVKFANYVLGVYISNIENYIEWLLKQRIRVDKWSSDQVYEQYIKEFNFRESVDRAVERTIIELKNWSESVNKPWNNFFNEVSQPRAIHMIRSGKISPWILYNSQSGLQWLETLNEEQMIMINEYINPNAWSKRFNDSPDDVQFVLELTKKAEL